MKSLDAIACQLLKNVEQSKHREVRDQLPPIAVLPSRKRNKTWAVKRIVHSSGDSPSSMRPTPSEPHCNNQIMVNIDEMDITPHYHMDISTTTASSPGTNTTLQDYMDITATIPHSSWSISVASYTIQDINWLKFVSHQNEEDNVPLSSAAHSSSSNKTTGGDVDKTCRTSMSKRRTTKFLEGFIKLSLPSTIPQRWEHTCPPDTDEGLRYLPFCKKLKFFENVNGRFLLENISLVRKTSQVRKISITSSIWTSSGELHFGGSQVCSCFLFTSILWYSPEEFSDNCSGSFRNLFRKHF